MDQRITLQSVSRTSDGGGGTSSEWVNFATVWAKVFPKGGAESLDEDRVAATMSYEITIRNRTDIDETMRVVWLGETYNIRGVHRMGPRPLYVKIEAERGAADLA